MWHKCSIMRQTASGPYITPEGAESISSGHKGSGYSWRCYEAHKQNLVTSRSTVSAISCPPSQPRLIVPFLFPVQSELMRAFSPNQEGLVYAVLGGAIRRGARKDSAGKNITDDRRCFGLLGNHCNAWAENRPHCPEECPDSWERRLLKTLQITTVALLLLEKLYKWLNSLTGWHDDNEKKLKQKTCRAFERDY